MEFLYEIDKAIFLFFNARLIHPVLDAVMTHITHFKFWVIPGLAAAAVYVFRARDKRRAFAVLGLLVLAAGLSDLISAQILKPAFARPRPCHPEFYVEGGRFLLGMRRALVSFPSSHSMNMFASATLLWCFYPKLWMYFFPFAALIAYSRVYVGVHYPADIFFGAVFGVGGVLAVRRIVLKYGRPRRIVAGAEINTE